MAIWDVFQVASVPGYHSDKRKVYVDKEAKKYKVVSMPRFGQARLRQVLEGDKCQHVAFQVGTVTPCSLHPENLYRYLLARQKH